MCLQVEGSRSCKPASDRPEVDIFGGDIDDGVLVSVFDQYT